jgi:hypothetical protein
VALVKLGDYSRFITDQNGKLIKHIFESNVRDYQGNIAVNSAIQETLSNNMNEDFWWLNNGVTILASDVHLMTIKEMRISTPEIVNGLQTSNEVYLFFNSNPIRLSSDNRNILVRIIVPVNDASRDKIIFATNNQTAIQKSALRATDTIHRDIEIYFKSKNLFYDRRKNYYKNQGKKAAEIISVPFLSQCLISVLLQAPNDARARPSTLLTNDDRYKELYNSKHGFDMFYNIAREGRFVESVLKSECNLSLTEVSDLKFYVLFAVFAKALGRIDIKASDVAAMRIDDITETMIRTTVIEIKQMYDKLGGDDRVAKGSALITKLKEFLLLTFNA